MPTREASASGSRDRRPIRQRLADHYSEAELDLWLYRPQPALDGQPPKSLVDQGRAEEVHALIDRMDEGLPP
jgi:uncharacterized protein (DUF2384 family)